jgi:hypothetical protein
MQHSRVKLTVALTIALAGALGAQALPNPLPLKYVGPPTVAAITAGDLMTRLYKYADDSMMGRDVGTKYHLMAVAYIESEVRRLGLKPGGTNGSYYQDFPIYSRTLDPVSTLSVAGNPLKFGVDFIPAIRGRVKEYNNVPVVYAGLLTDTTTLLDSAAVAGKVLLLKGVQVSSAVAASASYKAFQHAVAGAAGTIQIQGDSLARALVQNLSGPSELMEEGPEISPVILVTNAAAAAILGGPLATATKGQVGQAITTDVRYTWTKNELPGRNVVAILPGSDAKLKGEYVAIGGHTDHIGFNTRPVEHDSLKVFNTIGRPAGAEGGHVGPVTQEEWVRINAGIDSLRKIYPSRVDSIANGADDDGSGTVSVLEIAEAFAKGSVKPKRSILFVWHAGEEHGMWGSGYFMDNPTISRDSIVAQLNIDMVGRGAATDVTGQAKTLKPGTPGAPLHGGDHYLQLVGSRRLSTELGDVVEKVNTDKKLGFVFDYNIDADGHQQNIYCRSDHWSYGKWGVPVVFFTTGGHADYHQVTDEPQYIRYDHMAAIDNLIFDIAVTTANLDHRVVVDHPKPNPAPATSCKQ